MILSLRRAALFIAVSTASVSAMAQELSTDEQKVGYSIGASIGGNLAQQGITADIDVPALVQGFQDALGGSELKMDQAAMEAAIQQFQGELQARASALLEEQAAAGQAFLDENKSKPGVTTTASGLQYMVITEGSDSGAEKPSETDTVNVHYHGTLIDGTVFDSSVERGEPISFPLNGVIPGWTEGLQLMNVGDKYRFFIPSDLAYGPNGAGPIGPNATLIFDVELLGIEDAAAAQ